MEEEGEDRGEQGRAQFPVLQRERGSGEVPSFPGKKRRRKERDFRKSVLLLSSVVLHCERGENKKPVSCAFFGKRSRLETLGSFAHIILFYFLLRSADSQIRENKAAAAKQIYLFLSFVHILLRQRIRA